MMRAIHRAKYVMPEPGRLLENGCVHFSEDGRIEAVEAWSGAPPGVEAHVVDWGSSLLLPGLVNAHAHLELTRLSGSIVPGERFTDWLLQLSHGLRQTQATELWDAAVEGAWMCLASGTTLIGDISSAGVSRNALRGVPVRKVVFEEAIGLDPEKAGTEAAELESRLAGGKAADLLLQGVSPHAPYSVSAELYRRAAELARERRIPCATHVAETPAETEFLRDGRGEFVGFLQGLGSLPPAWTPPGLPPVPYLERLGVLGDGLLLIHCNYMDPESLGLIRRAGCCVVFCPRSHSYFGHRDHPVRSLLDAGIQVALGTDSLASNDSLSMLDEMRYLFRSRRDLRDDEILRMATESGAAALRLAASCGRLREGYWADMTVLEIPGHCGGPTLWSEVLEGAGHCVATIVGGKTVRQEAGESASRPAASPGPAG